MLIRNRVVTLERIEVSEWSGERLEDNAYRETCQVSAHLSDGSQETATATVEYGPGERERLVEPILKGTATEREQNDCLNLLMRRRNETERARGRLQKMYGNGIVRSA